MSTTSEELERQILDALPTRPKTYNDSAEESLEKKVNLLERRRDYLRKAISEAQSKGQSNRTSYMRAEANALDFAVSFIEGDWEAACQLIEQRRKERA